MLWQGPGGQTVANVRACDGLHAARPGKPSSRSNTETEGMRGIIWGYTGITEKKTDTTIEGLGFRVSRE